MTVRLKTIMAPPHAAKASVYSRTRVRIPLKEEQSIALRVLSMKKMFSIGSAKVSL